MNLAEKIYELRTMQNLSQGDLADLLEVSRQSVSKWETGSSVPDLDKLIKLSEVFHVTLDELVLDRRTDTKQRAYEQTEKRISTSPQTVAGIILLIMSFFALLFGVIHESGITLLCFPLVICGVICLRCKLYPALFCFWSLFLMTDLFFSVGTGQTWSNVIPQIIYYVTGIGGIGTIAFLFSCGMQLYAVTLIVATVRLFREKIFSLSKRTRFLIPVGTGISFLLPLILLALEGRLSLHISPITLMFLFALTYDIFLILLTISLILLFQYLHRKKSVA